MMKSILCLVILSFGLTPLLAASEVESEPVNEAVELLDSIIAVQAKLKSASGIITYKVVYTKDKEREPDTYKAKLQVAVPDKYNFFLQKGDQKEWFISNGKFEWHVEDIDGFKVDSKKELENGKGKFSSITDFIPLRREKLEKHFHIKAKTVGEDCKIKGAFCVVELKPITADQKDHVKHSKIYMDKKYQSVCIQILDANDNLYDIKIDKMKYNTELPKDTFTYTSE